MINSLEKLREFVDGNNDIDVPVISYQEWLICLKIFIEKIRSDSLIGNDLYNGSLLLFVEASGFTNPNDEMEYNRFCDLIRNFNNAYSYAKSTSPNYNASSSEVWARVINGTAIIDEESEYRPLR